jgi:hypothetical protein
MWSTLTISTFSPASISQLLNYDCTKKKMWVACHKMTFGSSGVNYCTSVFHHSTTIGMKKISPASLRALCRSFREFRCGWRTDEGEFPPVGAVFLLGLFTPYISPSAVLILIRPYNLHPTCDLTLFSPTRDSYDGPFWERCHGRVWQLRVPLPRIGPCLRVSWSS